MIEMQMWERAELKKRAKAVLKNSYWKAFLVALVLSFTGGGPNVSTNFHFPSSHKFDFSFGAGDGMPVPGDFQSGMPHMESPATVLDQIFGHAPIFLGIFAMIMLFVLLAAIAFGVFLTSPLEVSSKRYLQEYGLQNGICTYEEMNLVDMNFH